MGAFYYDQSSTIPVNITITPYGTPIQIPSSGGVVSFSIILENTAPYSVEFDVWTMAVLPSGELYGPLILRENILLNAGNILSSDTINQLIPQNAPPGIYQYCGYAGNYPLVSEFDSFTFEKLEDGTGEIVYNYWDVYGWAERLNIGSKNCLLIEGVAISIEPNPFNAEAIINLQIVKSADYKMSVYNVRGQRILDLYEGYLPKGRYRFNLEGGNISSGIYFLMLNTTDNVIVRKFMILK